MIANILDYLRWRGDVPLKYSEFNEVDGAVLARITYLPFEYALEPESMEKIRLDTVADKLLRHHECISIIRKNDDVELLKLLKESERFKSMVLFGFVNKLEAETQTQFSAITVGTEEESCYVAFRGTDNTLIGWKEDFNMGFVCPVPAQKLSVKYIEGIAEHSKGELTVGGHSKGGNLAVYAAAFCSQEVQGRIRTVYNYDGPGFDGKVLEQESYKRITDRVNTFVPQSSIVGMLLEHEESYTIVHSEQTGLMQHNIYSWDVERNKFLYLESVDSNSKFVDYTIKAWIADMDYAQREEFIDTVYTVIRETNVKTLRELSDNWFASAKIVLKSVKNLDEETRKTVMQALRLLLKSAKAGFILTRQSRKIHEDEK